MRRFRYARDPLCGIACALYVANRWLLPLAWRGPFLRHHFNDLLFIPAALPLMLWLQRRLGLRATDAMPGAGEVLWHVVLWSLAAEVVGPHVFARATGDIWDVAAYAAGAAVALLFWQAPWRPAARLPAVS